MQKRYTLAAFVALVAGFLFVWAAGASAQTVTSDPIQTTPGYPGCGGNSQIRDVTADYTCGNQRTFHLGPITRTVIAISTFHADGTAQTTFTLTGGVAPTNLNLRIVSHEGPSADGPTFYEVTGTMPVGTKGPVTLSYLFDCGQVDIKAILTGNGESAGRISGPYLCKVQPTTTTTAAPTTTAPGTTLPGQTTTAAVSPSTALTAVGVTLPATGRSGIWPITYLAAIVVPIGTMLILITRRRSAS